MKVEVPSFRGYTTAEMNTKSDSQYYFQVEKMIISIKSILAKVEVSSALPLEEMARKLSAIIGGFTFKHDETGRFEEVPAFFAKDNSSGITFFLFGIPEGETCDAYTLQCTSETGLSIPDFSRSLFGFMSNIIFEKNINARGYYDYSEELAVALTSSGISAIKSAP